MPVINAPVMMPVISGPDVNDPPRAVVVVVAVRIIPGTAAVVAKPERKREIDPH
jgi:hypothetical protein